MLPRLEGGRFLGKTLRARSCGGFHFADVLYPAGSRLPKHAHERAYLCLIRQGGYHEAYGRRSRECRPLTVAFHPQGEPHEQTFGSEAVASFNIEIGTERLDGMREIAGPLDQPAEFHGGRIAGIAMRLYAEFAYYAEEPSRELESLACELLAEAGGIENHCAGRPRWFANARELLDVCFDAAPSIHELAAEAGIHPVYFAAAFRRYAGCSVGDYVRRRRIEYARRRLADRDVPLSELALEAGFADQSHLTRTFKRFTGMTPAQYRTFLRFKTN